MPELPEVETMRRGVLAVVGSRIENVARPKCRLKPILLTPRIDVFRRRAIGQRIAAIDRLGKRVVVRLDSSDAIVLEPRMTGLVLLADPPDQEHLRLVLELRGGTAARLMFWDRRGLGTARLLSEAELTSLVAKRLGPDALAVSAGELRARFSRSRREIKVALLDQQALAGVGNLYASEILHLAGVHPQARCDRLRVAQWTAIHAALVEVLSEAIRHEGSTLSDGTYRNALNESGGYQNHHRVYDRADSACPRCQSGQIRRIVQAQRSTIFCPRCQTRKW
jgi:formamidopyrimidine-DNA glycosylase